MDPYRKNVFKTQLIKRIDLSSIYPQLLIQESMRNDVDEKHLSVEIQIKYV